MSQSSPYGGRVSTQSVPEDLKNVLGPNEQVQLYIRQKIYHPKVNIDSVVVTNERIILRHPHSLGLRRDYTDYNYQDISNVVFKKGLLRSTVSCTLRFGGEPVSLNDLPNSEAQKAYGIIRENLVRFQAPFASSGIPPFREAPAQMLQGTACSKCGAPASSGQKFCGVCGSPL